MVAMTTLFAAVASTPAAFGQIDVPDLDIEAPNFCAELPGDLETLFPECDEQIDAPINDALDRLRNNLDRLEDLLEE